MSTLGWYLGRAGAMSPSEAAWRVRRLGADLFGAGEPRERADVTVLTDASRDWDALAQAFRDGVDRPVLLDESRAQHIANTQQVDVAALLGEAEKLLRGERTYFGYRTVTLGAPRDWNFDPISGHHWPTIAAKRINHRAAQSDPKWIWELNRLQHLPVLAQAWLFTGDTRFADTAFDELDTWLDQNPVGIGVAWRGAFEAGIRAMSVAVAMQGLRHAPSFTTARYRRVVRMLDASARYCWSARSLYSSANNHLVGEITGLLVVHLLFPELAAPNRVAPRAFGLLSQEADRQILSDGVGAEQSVAYQMFTAELFATVVALLRLRGDRVPSPLTDALERNSGYLANLLGADESVPAYGDDDDGFALRLGVESKRTVRHHLAIVAASTGSKAAGVQTLTSAWLATSSEPPARDTGRGTDTSAAVDGFYAADGGLAVLRSGRRRLTMDVGPLGYLSIAAHGHADALAITLSEDGRDLIVDPGTSSYYGKPAWRNVDRGTHAHATVCVDDVDQSVIGGPFYWRTHAKTTVHAVDVGRGIVDAEHDGYRRLDDAVVHRRWVIAPPDQDTVAVVDLLDGCSAHDVAVSWPLHPALDMEPTEHGHLAKSGGTPVLRLSYAATTPLPWQEIRGNAETNLGWHSERLESRQPAWLVGLQGRATLPLAVLTLLQTSNTNTITEPRIALDGQFLFVSWLEERVRREWVIERTAGGAVLGVHPSPAANQGNTK